MVRARSSRTGAAIQPARAYRGQQDLVCAECSERVLLCHGAVIDPYFKHYVANPNCDDSIVSDYEPDADDEASASVRLVLRRSWADDPMAGRYAREVIGNSWSLAVRLPMLRFRDGKPNDTFLLRVGEARTETRSVRELEHHRDYPVRPYSGTYGIVDVDGKKATYRQLLELKVTSLRPSGTFFAAAEVSLATTTVRWSQSYDCVRQQPLVIDEAPESFDIAEISTDRSLAAYRGWNCYRVRLPADPTAVDIAWWSSMFGLTPGFPEVALSLVWPNALGESAKGVRLLPPTQTIVLAATRKAPGKMYLHSLIGNENGYEAEAISIPSALNTTFIFGIDLTGFGQSPDVSFGWGDTPESRSWAPIERLEVSTRCTQVNSGILFTFRLGNVDSVSLDIFDELLENYLSEARLGSVTLLEIKTPPGIKCTIKMRASGRALWDSVITIGAVEIVEVLKSNIRDTKIEILLSFSGFRSFFLQGDDTTQELLEPAPRLPQWIKRAALLSRLPQAMSAKRITSVRMIAFHSLSDYAEVATSIIRSRRNGGD